MSRWDVLPPDEDVPNPTGKSSDSDRLAGTVQKPASKCRSSQRLVGNERMHVGRVASHTPCSVLRTGFSGASEAQVKLPHDTRSFFFALVYVLFSVHVKRVYQYRQLGTVP